MRDERAFSEFVEARSPALVRHAQLLCGDRDRAVELVERGLAAAYRRWPELGADGAEAAARQAILTAALGRRGRLPVRRSRPVADAGDVTEVVWRALDGLPVRRRAVLVLRYADRLGDAEIADRLGARPAAVAGEAAAGLAALGRILRGRGRPEDLLPAALADRAAPPGVTGARPAAADVVARVRRERRHRRVVRVGWAVTVVVVAALAVVVPATVGRGGAAGPVPPTVAVAEAVPLGLLSWPARGSLAGDRQLLRTALATWQADAPAAQRPASAVSVLYAGEVAGARLVLLQAVDGAGQARVAELTGGASGLRVVRSDPLVPRIPVLAVPAGEPAADVIGSPAPTTPGTGTVPAAPAGTTPAGTAPAAAPAPAAAAVPGRLRLLGPPSDASALYVRAGSQPAADPLRRLERDGTGLSEPFDSPGETYVVVLGTAATQPTGPPPSAAPTGPPPSAPPTGPPPSAAPTGSPTAQPAGAAPGAAGDTGTATAGPATTGSGVVSTARLTASPDLVEYAVPTLAVAGPAVPSYGWYTDGRLLAGLLHHPARVAAIGPGFRWRPRTGPARGHEFHSQGYEVTSAGQRLLSVVVRLDGRPLCADLSPLGRAGSPPQAKLVVQRCVAPRFGAGVVQVIAPPGTAAVALTLATDRPGQRRYQRSFRAPAGTASAVGFVGAGLIDAGFPTGGGRALASTAAGRPAGRGLLPAYRR